MLDQNRHREIEPLPGCGTRASPMTLIMLAVLTAPPLLALPATDGF
jgi:hypothetical protein